MENILLVEDNEHILKINTKYLQAMGYRVFQATSIAEARTLIEQNVFDVIVLDIMLPDGNGVDFCKELRERSACPVLFLTAKVSDEDIVSGFENGGDDYLTKPYDLDVFGARVKALIRRSKSTLPQNSRYSVGALYFDIVKSQAFAENTELLLSGKEFGLLLYLAQHRARKVSKEELFKAVWGVRADSDFTAVWTTVSRLNKKIAGYAHLFYIDSDHDGYELVMIKAGRQ